MDYYAGNGIYDFLKKSGMCDNFFWTSKNLWLLVYGDQYYEPRVLTVASEERLSAAITEEEKRAVHVAGQIVENTDVEVNFIRFAPGKRIEQVAFWTNGMRNIPLISSEELKDRFSQYGLKMNQMRTHKHINDKSSSPYHEWQREHMGDSVVVTDIDLVRFENGAPRELIELKRSCVNIEEWAPYREDYKNFILLSRLAQKRRLAFYIVYNYRRKRPFLDDISRLKIFQFDHRMQTCCSLLGYKTIEQFVENGTGEI